jgi:hypothetical protein
MEHTHIKELLDRYWEADTSLEEERQLKDYFRGPDVAPELERYRSAFAWADKAQRPSAGLEAKILSGLRETTPGNARQTPVRNLYRQGWWYAVAAVLVVCLGIQLIPRAPAPPAPPTAAVTTISDTYADPAQALAAVQKALRTVSSRMNKGREITRSRMGRLAVNYRLAFKN